MVSPAGPAPDLNGTGTPEAEWQYHRPWQEVAVVSPMEVVGSGNRVVVIAPHPDDEVLGVGGTVALLAGNGIPVHVVAVTDGEASDPGTDGLAGIRDQERREALAVLGGSVTITRLHLPDSGVDTGVLIDRLAATLSAGDVVMAPWEHDGHPDHDASGRAALLACHEVGTALWQYLVWVWHWDRPRPGGRIPWTRAARVDLDGPAWAAKARAVSCFSSQIGGPRPVLVPEVLDRLVRPFEVLVRPEVGWEDR